MASDSEGFCSSPMLTVAGSTRGASSFPHESTVASVVACIVTVGTIDAGSDSMDEDDNANSEAGSDAGTEMGGGPDSAAAHGTAPSHPRSSAS